MTIHYGADGYGECGAGHDDDPKAAGRASVTLVVAEVTCRTCRGWLPIVAPRAADDLSKLPLRADLNPRAFRIGTADANFKRGGFSA